MIILSSAQQRRSIKLIIKYQQTMYSFIKNCQEVIKNKSHPHTAAPPLPQQQIKSCELEHVARSNLCELSESICKEATARGQPLVRELEHYDCSPWGLKKEQICLEKDRGRSKKDGYVKVAQGKSIKNSSSVVSNEDKENLIHAKLSKYAREEYEVQRYPSIFMRIKAAKDVRSDTHKDRSETEIVTIMRKKKPNNGNEYSELKKIILAQQVENHTNNLKVFNKKIEDLEVLKKNSLNCIKQMPYCSVEEEGDKESATRPKVSIEHWKTKRVSIKSKKPKKTQETKSIQRRDSKQNISAASKKTSLSLQKGREQYQSSNPLTRLLYEKYINTISIGQRQQKFHFL